MGVKNKKYYVRIFLLLFFASFILKGTVTGYWVPTTLQDWAKKDCYAIRGIVKDVFKGDVIKECFGAQKYEGYQCVTREMFIKVDVIDEMKSFSWKDKETVISFQVSNYKQTSEKEDKSAILTTTEVVLINPDEFRFDITNVGKEYVFMTQSIASKRSEGQVYSLIDYFEIKDEKIRVLKDYRSNEFIDVSIDEAKKVLSYSDLNRTLILPSAYSLIKPKKDSE